MLTVLFLGVYAACLTAAAASDLRRFEIPDSASAILALAFIPLALTSFPMIETAAHVATGAVMFAIAALMFAAGIWGGGDVKLLGATAMWVGWRNLAAFLLLTAVIGGVLALVLITLRRLTKGRIAADRWYSRLLSPTEGAPYGVAIALAGLLLVTRLADAATVE